jgi:hypothetical protein
VSRDAGFAGNAGFARAGFSDPTLILRWPEIVGADIARIARPIKLSEGPYGAVLTLRAEPGAAVFLQHETRALCGKINAFLGRNAVARLRFVHGPVTAQSHKAPLPMRKAELPPTDPALSFKGKEGLREAILNLAKARKSGVKPAD